MSLDAVAVGGQAGASSRIENYAGFPNGISGRTSCRGPPSRPSASGPVSTPRATPPGFVPSTGSTSSPWPTAARSPAGRSSSPPVPATAGWRSTTSQRFEGAGVYYAATDLEARICTGRDVIVVGGGNSAGQAAIYMAQQGCKVSIAIRRDDLSQTMSRYLIERIEASPRIEVLANTEVRALAGAGPSRAR